MKFSGKQLPKHQVVTALVDIYCNQFLSEYCVYCEYCEKCCREKIGNGIINISVSHKTMNKSRSNLRQEMSVNKIVLAREF